MGRQGKSDSSGALSDGDGCRDSLAGADQLIQPHYPKAGNGTQPMPLERMLRIHFMEHWFNLSDPAMKDALYDSESMRRFTGIEWAEEAVADGVDDFALPTLAGAAAPVRENLRADPQVVGR